MNTHLQHADILWQTDDTGQSVPTSAVFGDVYFSKSGGLDETNYVFLQGNHLSERFKNIQKNQSFTIIETGFGTGLNFLATCLLWQETMSQENNPKNACLYFVSTEKFPLTKADLQTALSVWTDEKIRFFINQLIDNYPLALSGCHRLHFGNITLDLWLGDALDSFCKMSDKLADAWFLDGFAPSKNSELWSADIFNQIKRLSKPEATLATFTSSGFVKRELLRIGMNVNKIKGFGRKREMLTANFDNPIQNLHTPPQTVIVIGAGVSGLFTAYALASRGVAVTLMDKTALIAGASGNPRAMFAPKLSLIDGVAEHLPSVSFLYAERIYRKFNELSGTEIFTQTGVVDFLLPTQKSADKLTCLANSYPDELIQIVNADIDDFTKQKIVTFIKKAGLINPKLLAEFILSHPNITFKQANIISITESHRQTILTDDKNNKYDSDVAIICGGFESYLLDDTLFNPRKIRGQVSYYQNKNIKQINHLKTPIKYDGYCATFDDIFLMGASFVRNCTDTDIRLSEHEFNLEKLTQSLPNIVKELNVNINELQGRASIRAQTPDYHPIVGNVGCYKNLFTIYGMGSKGFSFAPLCGEIIADMIFNNPICISQNLLNKLSPTRPRLQTPLNHNE